MRPPNLWHVPLAARLIFRVSQRSRQRKLWMFYESIHPQPCDTVLDVGVTPIAWSSQNGCSTVENFLESSYPWPDRMVAVSIEGLGGFMAAHQHIRGTQADACQLPFADRSFDIVFSNAVIEHVGDRTMQRQLVHECLRVARRAVFLAAPNQWFPYDTHVGFPLVHWLPRRIWRYFLTEPGLHLLSPKALGDLFPPSAHARRLTPLWFPSTVVVATPAHP